MVKKLQDLLTAILIGVFLIFIVGVYIYGGVRVFQDVTCDDQCVASKRIEIWQDCIADEYDVSTCDALLISIGGE